MGLLFLQTEFFFHEQRPGKPAHRQLCLKLAQKEGEAPYPSHPSHHGRCRSLRLGLLGTEPGITTPGAQTRGEDGREGGNARREGDAGCQAARPRQRRAGGPPAHAGNRRPRRAPAPARQPPGLSWAAARPPPAAPGRVGERRGSAPSAAEAGRWALPGPRRRKAGAGEPPSRRGSRNGCPRSTTLPGGRAAESERGRVRRPCPGRDTPTTGSDSAVEHPAPPGRAKEGCGGAARGAPTLLSRTHAGTDRASAALRGPALTGGGGSSSSAAGGKAKGARSPPRSAGRSRGPRRLR